VSFYRKSAGVLHDVLEFLQDVCNFSTRCSKMRFWRVDEGRKVKKWVWRLDKGVRKSKTWWMELRSGEDGWTCSRRGRAMLHEKMEIRSK